MKYDEYTETMDQSFDEQEVGRLLTALEGEYTVLLPLMHYPALDS